MDLSLYCGSRTTISPNFVCQRSFFTLAVHPGLAANVPLRCLDPLVRPALQRLEAQKPHLVDKPLFGRVRLQEVSVQVPHRAYYRRHSVTKIRMGLEKGQKRCVAEFCHRHGSIPSIAESSVYSPQGRIAPDGLACRGGTE